MSATSFHGRVTYRQNHGREAVNLHINQALWAKYLQLKTELNEQMEAYDTESEESDSDLESDV